MYRGNAQLPLGNDAQRDRERLNFRSIFLCFSGRVSCDEIFVSVNHYLPAFFSRWPGPELDLKTRLRASLQCRALLSRKLNCDS